MDFTKSTLEHHEVLHVIKACIFCPGRAAAKGQALNDKKKGRPSKKSKQTWGLPLFVWDEPGTGKTSAIEQLGHNLGLDYVSTIAMNNRPAEDIGGYAVPDHERHTMDRYPDPWVHNANQATRGLQIFDEFSTSDEERQAACLRVFSENMAGDVRINGAVRLIALGNPPECSANGHDLSPPAANRFGHLAWVGFSTKEWGEWLLTGAGGQKMEPLDVQSHEGYVLERFPAAFAKSGALCLEYLVKFPDDFHRLPKSGEPEQLRWPSRRTWEMTARFLASADIHGLTQVERDCGINAFLPSGVAEQFITWLADQDLPGVLEVLENEGSYLQYEISKRMDITHTILGMTSSYLVNPDVPNRRMLAGAWWRFADRVHDHRYGGGDLIEGTARRMTKAVSEGGAGLGPDEGIVGSQVIVTKMAGVLQAKLNACDALRAEGNNDK